MEDQNRNRIFAGAILVILGVGLLALQYTSGFGQSMTTFLIGGLFVAGYFFRRSYGLLIPGCVLLGLGLGSIGERSLLTFGDFQTIGLGIGFISIYLIDVIYRGATHWWPLIPGVFLIVTGFARGNAVFQRLLSIGWPLLLVFVGLLLVFGAYGLTGRKKE